MALPFLPDDCWRLIAERLALGDRRSLALVCKHICLALRPAFSHLSVSRIDDVKALKSLLHTRQYFTSLYFAFMTPRIYEAVASACPWVRFLAVRAFDADGRPPRGGGGRLRSLESARLTQVVPEWLFADLERVQTLRIDVTSAAPFMLPLECPQVTSMQVTSFGSFPLASLPFFPLLRSLRIKFKSLVDVGDTSWLVDDDWRARSFSLLPLLERLPPSLTDLALYGLGDVDDLGCVMDALPTALPNLTALHVSTLGHRRDVDIRRVHTWCYRAVPLTTLGSLRELHWPAVDIHIRDLESLPHLEALSIDFLQRMDHPPPVTARPLRVLQMPLLRVRLDHLMPHMDTLQHLTLLEAAQTLVEAVLCTCRSLRSLSVHTYQAGGPRQPGFSRGTVPAAAAPCAAVHPVLAPLEALHLGKLVNLTESPQGSAPVPLLTLVPGLRRLDLDLEAVPEPVADDVLAAAFAHCPGLTHLRLRSVVLPKAPLPRRLTKLAIRAAHETGESSAPPVARSRRGPARPAPAPLPLCARPRAVEQVHWADVLAPCASLECFKLIGRPSDTRPVVAPAGLLHALGRCCPNLERLVLKCDALGDGVVPALSCLPRLHRLQLEVARGGELVDEWQAVLPDCHYLRVIAVGTAVPSQPSLYALCEQLGIDFVQSF